LSTLPSWWLNKNLSGIITMSDILFLSVKEHAGKIRSNEGFLSTTGDLAALTANAGKEMYLARAKVVFFTNTTNVSADDEVVLKINGTIIETVKYSSAVSSGSGIGGNAKAYYSFENMGHKVAAWEIIKLEVIALSSVVDVEGFIECFEEPTGQSPYQSSEFT